MLSDSPFQQRLPSPKVRSGTWYPDSTKQDAVKLWLTSGSLKQVSTSMNVPYDTLKSWRASKWWAELALEIRTEGHLALSHKMQKLADKAMEVTLDRLQNGDAVYNQKTGEITTKPVSMRDAHQVAVSFQDRAIKLASAPQDEAAQIQVQDRLQAIADAFAKMIKSPKQQEVIDVSFTEHAEGQPPEAGNQSQEADAEAGAESLNALPEEREERLQEGSPVGEDETTPQAEGPRSEDSGAEIGGEDDRQPTQ